MLDIFCAYFVLYIFASRCMAILVDLDALESFNSTKNFEPSNPGTSIVNITHALEGLVGCFRQVPPHEPQLCRTSFTDCFNAVAKISALDTHSLVHFRRNNDSAFLLPNYFTYNTCVIFLDMVSADAEDFFYIAQVRDVVIDTARKCTSLRMALGGKAMAGPRMLMVVDVWGRLWPLGNGAIGTATIDSDDAVA